MTIQTAAFLSHHTVFVLRCLGYLLNVFVTRIAELGRILNKHLWIVCPVNIVTADAFSPGGFVNELESLQLVLRNLMAGKAKIVWIDIEQILIVGSMRVMTDTALSGGNRSVQELHALRSLVTLVTRFGNGLARQKELVVAAVRVMTLSTAALLACKRIVQVSLGRLVQMTILAKLRPFARKLVSVFLLVKGFVAALAVAECDRTMHLCVLAILGMALCCQTRLLWRGGLVHGKASRSQHTN
jgi:hypothetical protein